MAGTAEEVHTANTAVRGDHGGEINAELYIGAQHSECHAQR